MGDDFLPMPRPEGMPDGVNGEPWVGVPKCRQCGAPLVTEPDDPPFVRDGDTVSFRYTIRASCECRPFAAFGVPASPFACLPVHPSHGVIATGHGLPTGELSMAVVDPLVVDSTWKAVPPDPGDQEG